MTLDALAIPNQSLHTGNAAKRSVDPEAHRADGLFRAAAVGSRDPRNPNPDLGSRGLAHAERHRACDLDADRAVRLDELRSDAEHPRFDVVRIGDDAAMEPTTSP